MEILVEEIIDVVDEIYELDYPDKSIRKNIS